jgi:hypothetical protein
VFDAERFKLRRQVLRAVRALALCAQRRRRMTNNKVSLAPVSSLVD